MKKDSVSTLSADSSLQKIPRTSLSSPTPAGGQTKSKYELPKTRGVTGGNGRNSNGGKSSDRGTVQAMDANRVLTALIALKKGDFNARLPVGWTGIAGKVADTF